MKFIITLFNFILRVVRSVLFIKGSDPTKILVFRTGSIGDTVCAIPAIEAIRKAYPNARLTILTNSGGSKLVGMKSIVDPAIYDELIDYYGMGSKQLLGLSRKNKYDLFIQLPQTDAGFWRLLRDMLFFRMVAPSGWGWEYSTFPYFRQFQEKRIVFPNETDRLLRLLKKNGIESKNAGFRLHLHVPEDRRKVEKDFLEAGLKETDFILAIIVGAKRPQNRWPIQYFEKVVDHFRDTCKMVLIGGPEDRVLTSGLRAIPGVTDFTGVFTPMQSAIALQRCTLTLSNDTGPMHLSYASGTPTIGLFSSRDFPGKWAPPVGNGNSWFRTPHIHCSLCLSETCSNNICMQVIQPQLVIEKIELFIKEHNNRAQPLDS